MSVSNPSIQNAELKMTINPALVSGVSAPEAVDCTFKFAGQTFNDFIRGTFTPANSLVTLHTFSSTDAPTMLLVIVDLLTDLFITANTDNVVADLPINKCFFVTMPQLSGTPEQIAAIKFDGRTSIAKPMAQGVPVHYFIAWGDGTIT